MSSKIRKHENKEKQYNRETDPCVEHFPKEFWDKQKTEIIWLNPDHFKCYEFVQSGIYGDIFRGQYLETRKNYLIKHASYNDLDKIKKEITILKYLKAAPNVTRYYGIYKLANSRRISIITDFMHKTHIDSIETVDMRHYMKELITGLEYCHRVGVMHRHLCPRNLIINKLARKLLIIEWGEAEFIFSNVSLPTKIGEKYYRAPELLFDINVYDNAVDMWAAGCIIAGMIFQRFPFFSDQSGDELLSLAKMFGADEVSKIMKEKGGHVDPDYRRRFYPFVYFNFDFFLSKDNITISLETKNFLKSLLMLDWEKRLTAVEALNLDFFKSIETL